MVYYCFTFLLYLAATQAYWLIDQLCSFCANTFNVTAFYFEAAKVGNPYEKNCYKTALNKTYSFQKQLYNKLLTICCLKTAIYPLISVFAKLYFGTCKRLYMFVVLK
jgi:hypothetical protein